MEVTIIFCFITYIGFETARWGKETLDRLIGLTLFFLGLGGLFTRLLVNILT